MIPEETRIAARMLASMGRGHRWIGRHLKIHRKTAKAILKGHEPRARPVKPRILDPFRDRIRQLIEEDKIGELTETVVFQRLKEEGYRGGRTAVGEFVRSIRRLRKRRAYCRFETDPGETAQIDWSPYRLLVGARSLVVHVFSMVLGWSRYQYLEAFLDEKQDTLFYAHSAAFRFFDGVQAIGVYDHMATVAGPRIGTRTLVNERFERFAQHYNFEVHFATDAPANGERSKRPSPTSKATSFRVANPSLPWRT